LSDASGNDVVLQGMAGNIIHAIATTNAHRWVGSIVAEALKILAGSSLVGSQAIPAQPWMA